MIGFEAAYDASKMMEELRKAEAFLEPFFDDWEDDLERYAGPGFRADTAAEEYDPENFALEWATFVGTQCLFGTPRVRVSTSRMGHQREMAKAHEFAMNRWIGSSRIHALNEKLVMDFGQRWAVALTLPGWQAGTSEHEDARNWPTVRRISPKMFGWDPAAEEFEHAAYYFHKSIHYLSDLEREAEDDPDTWNAEAIALLQPSSGIDEIRGDRKEEIPERGEVVLYNVYVPGYEPTDEDRKRLGDEAWGENGVWGAWLVLGKHQAEDGEMRTAFVRPAYPYWGRRRGPYTFAGHMVVPDEVAQLAPIPAVRAQNEALNDHARAADRAMNLHKKGILVDASDPDWEDKIRDFESHFVVGLDGLDEIHKKVMEVELAGVTPLHEKHNAILLDRRSRVSGLSQAMQGQPASDVTATADQIAQEAGSQRIGYQVLKFRRDVVEDYLEAVSWYIHHDDLEIELGPEAEGLFTDEVTGEPLERVIYVGGVDEEEDGEEEDFWESMGLDIEPYSMEKTSEALQQRRMIDLTNFLGWVIPMMPQAPYVKWDDIIEAVGEGMNWPGLGDFFDMDVLQQFRQVMLQMEIEGAQGRSGGVQPRTPGDASSVFARNAGGGSLQLSSGEGGSPLGTSLGKMVGANVGAGVG